MIKKENQQLLDQFKSILIKSKYSESSQQTYCSHLNKFAKKIQDKLIIDCTNVDYIDFIENNENYHTVIAATQSIKLFLNVMFDVKFKYKTSREHVYAKIENNLSYEKVIEVCDKIEDISHKCIIMLTFSLALQYNELVNIKIENINFEKKTISICAKNQSAGRVLPLTDSVLKTISNHIYTYRPLKYLFYDNSSDRYSKNKCQKIIQQYFGLKYSFSDLRNACLFTLAKKGLDTEYLQYFAGHLNRKITMSYRQPIDVVLKNIQLL